MDEKKTGRKKDFTPEQDPERLHIILPKETIIALEVFTARNPLSRNQIINKAILEHIQKAEE